MHHLEGDEDVMISMTFTAVKRPVKVESSTESSEYEDSDEDDTHVQADTSNNPFSVLQPEAPAFTPAFYSPTDDGPKERWTTVGGDKVYDNHLSDN